MKKFLSTIIFLASIICFCWSAFSLGRYAWQSWTTQKNLNNLAQEISTPPLLIDEAGDTETEEISESEQMMEKCGNL